MTINSEQIQALKAAAEKATPGEWWSDVIDAEDITTWAVYDPDNRSLLDMLNSTAAEIHEEYDRDYFMQWDETAKRNADFIAKAHPEFILSLLAERDADKALIAELAGALEDCVYRIDCTIIRGEATLLDIETARKSHALLAGITLDVGE